MIELPTHEPLTAAIWKRLIELTALQPEGWTLVGAQTVALHGHEHGKTPPRSTTDADVLVNVRAAHTSLFASSRGCDDVLD